MGKSYQQKKEKKKTINDLQTLFFEKRHRLFYLLRNGAILDTEVLILYLVGVFDKRNRTDNLGRLGYKMYDFDTLVRFKQQMKIGTFVVTPNILTEFFNQIENKIGGWFFTKNLQDIKIILSSLIEKYQNKNDIIDISKFGEFDFADLSLYLTSKNENFPLITNDLKLSRLCKFGGEHQHTLIIHFPEITNLRVLMSKRG
ncbi:MAG: hypothetical protein U9O53_01705 [archaeon]|nr:hypothetical protein [archaeon]